MRDEVELQIDKLYFGRKLYRRIRKLTNNYGDRYGRYACNETRLMAMSLQTVGRLKTYFDTEKRIARINAQGMWTPAQVDACFGDLKIIRDNHFLGNQPFLVFVDRRGTVVQSAETADRLHMQTKTFYNMGDRVAVLVDSSLAKMQLKRVLDERSHKLFIAESAALLWLKGW